MFTFRKKKNKQASKTSEDARLVSSPVSQQTVANSAVESQGGAENAQLDVKLKKSRAHFGKRLVQLFRFRKKIDDELLEDIETALITADLGVATVNTVTQSLADQVKRRHLSDPAELYGKLRGLLLSQIAEIEKPLVFEQKKPFVILTVGINGAGKTTTIGKLAHRLKAEGKSVMLAAGDTFRAAAVEQLKTWGQRLDVPVVAQDTGADSASVIFDALQSAKAKQLDVLIADTAGRLHTQTDLMDELAKIKRVMAKLDVDAPHEVLLVIDGGSGQNAISQAKKFHEMIGVSGLVITKLDGTAKGGVLFGINQELGLPVRYIGVGEKPADLRPFDAGLYVEAMLPDLAE